MVQYFPSVSNAHIFYLVSKTRSQKPVENLTDVIIDYYIKLDKVSEISIILRTVQFADYLDIIFDFDEAEICKVNPTVSNFTRGEARYKDGRIYVAAGSGRTESEILGTLAHELTHMAMQILYKNDCNPYGKLDLESENFFRDFKNRIRSIIKSKALGPSKILLDALDNYYAYDHDSELIVRIPHILIQYGNGREWLLRNVPELVEFYKKNIVPKCEEFIKESVVLKPKSTIRSINESVGEVLKLKSCDISFKNLRAVTDFLQKDKNIFLYEINNTFLGALKVLQALFGKEYMNSCNNFLVLKFKNFITQISEIIEAFFSEASNVMIIQMDNTPTDDELSKSFYLISLLLVQKPYKKIVFVTRRNFTKLLTKKCQIHQLMNNVASLSDADFSLDDLGTESQKKILKKKITFQGRRAILKTLIQDEKLYKFVTGEVLRTLLRNGSVSIGNEILGLSHLEGPYADISMEMDVESFVRYLKISDDIFLIRSKLKNDVVEYFDSNFENEWIHTEFVSNKTYKEKIIVVNDRFQHEDFKNFCRMNSGRKCHLVDWEANSLILQQIYNPKFYMKRKVKRITLKPEVITKLSTENKCQNFIIIIASKHKKVLEKSDNVKFLCAEDAKAMFQTLSESGNNVHLFEIKEEKFIWKDSHGSMRELQKCLEKDNMDVLDEENLIVELMHKKIVLIADDPGMGKSTTLTKLYESRAISDAHWIIRINLKDHLKALRSHIKNINMEKVIRFLRDVEPTLKDDLNENLLKAALNNEFSKCVLLAFDGFDEIIDEDDREKVVSFLKFLKNETPSKIWITTRLQYKEDLEIALGTFAIELEPFDDEMKKLFVRKCLKDRLHLILKEDLFTDGKITTFSEKLLLKMREIFRVDVAKFIGTPLQLNLVMFDSLKYFKNWVENDLDLDFSYIGGNLWEVYENFIGKKYHVYFQKFNKIEKDTQRRERKISEQFHRKLAESLVYKRENLKPEEEEKQLILSIGLVRNNLEFIHFTLREFYFAQATADYLLGEIESEKTIFLFKEIFAKREFEMICSFLNIILDGNVPEKNLQFLKEMFLESGEILPPFTTLDSVFAIVAKKGYENIFKFVSSIYFYMVSASPSWNVVNIFNRALFYNATLSVKPEIWKEIFHILKKTDLKKKWEKMYYKCLIVRMIFLAIQHKCWELMILMLQEMKGIYSDIEMREIFLNLHRDYSHSINVIIVLLELGTDLFTQKELANFFMRHSFYCPTAFSVTANCIDCKFMESLISTSEKILKTGDEKRLLTMKNNFGETILHSAAGNISFKATRLILKKAGKIFTLEEQREFLTMIDSQNRTALYIAVYEDRVETAKLLIEYGDKLEVAEELLTIRNSEDQSILHSAISMNRMEIAKFLAEKAKKILKPEIFREWLITDEFIFSSVMNQNGYNLSDGKDRILLIKILFFENVEEILSKDDQCGILTKEHCIYGSIFHLAAYLGDVEFLKYILAKAEEILTPAKLCEFLMMEKKSGQTPLHLAVKKGLGTVKLLFDMNERILSSQNQARLMLITDGLGESVLHKAAYSNDVEVLAYVLERCKKLLPREVRRKLFIENPILHQLVCFNCKKIIDMMLEEIKDVLEEDEYYQLLIKSNKAYGTILHSGVWSENPEVVELLLNFLNTEQQREILTTTDIGGYSCLLIAIKVNKLEITTLLFNKLKEIFSLEKQSEILLATDRNNQTCLHLAAGKNRLKMMNFLLQKIEETLTPDQICQLMLQKSKPKGNTVVHEIAFTNQLDLLFLLFEKMESILPVKTQQALIMATDSNNLNILQEVVKNVNLDEKVFQMILNQAEKVLTQDQQLEFLMPAGKTDVFYTAIKLQKTEILKLLLFKAKKILKPEDLFEMMSKKVNHLNILEKESKCFDVRTFLMEKDPSSSSGTLLHEAAYNGESEILNLLLGYIEETLPPKEKSKIIMKKNEKSETFLYYILSNSYINKPEVLTSLFRKLQKILTPNDFRLLLITYDNTSGSIFHAAALNQKHKVLTLLFNEAEKLLTQKEIHDLFAAKAEEFRSVLHAALAVANRQPEVVTLIIKKGKQILTTKEQIKILTALDERSRTLLFLIDEHSLQDSHFVFLIITEWERLLSTKNQAKLLLKTDKSRRTALHMAVMKGKLEVIKLLLQHAEKVMSRGDLQKFLLMKDFEGKTALEMACSRNNYFTIRPLLEAFIEENRIGSDSVKGQEMNFLKIFSNRF